MPNPVDSFEQELSWINVEAARRIAVALLEGDETKAQEAKALTIALMAFSMIARIAARGDDQQYERLLLKAFSMVRVSPKVNRDTIASPVAGAAPDAPKVH